MTPTPHLNRVIRLARAYERFEHGREQHVGSYESALRHALTRHLLDDEGEDEYGVEHPGHAGDIDPWDVRAAHDSPDPIAALDRLHAQAHKHGLGSGHGYETPAAVQFRQHMARGRHLDIFTAPKGSLPGDRL